MWSCDEKTALRHLFSSYLLNGNNKKKLKLNQISSHYTLQRSKTFSICRFVACISTGLNALSQNDNHI